MLYSTINISSIVREVWLLSVDVRVTTATTTDYDRIKTDSEIALSNFNESFNSDKTNELYNYALNN